VEELGQLFGNEVQPTTWLTMFSNRAVEPGSPPDTLRPEAVFSNAR
jgi:hypothetical protein